MGCTASQGGNPQQQKLQQALCRTAVQTGRIGELTSGQSGSVASATTNVCRSCRHDVKAGRQRGKCWSIQIYSIIGTPCQA